VLDWPHIVNTARAEVPDRPFRHALTVSARMAAHATAPGRVLMTAFSLAELATCLAAPLPRYTPHTITEPADLLRALTKCREAGSAVLDGELEEGFASAAVPLTDSAGRLVAALVTSSHSGRRTASALRAEVVPLMQAATQQMSALLG
jgi:IclR family pca regulon transcriptional regulator